MLCHVNSYVESAIQEYIKNVLNTPSGYIAMSQFNSNHRLNRSKYV